MALRNRTQKINDFEMIYVTQKEIDVEKISALFHETFAKVWFRQVEDDRFHLLLGSVRVLGECQHRPGQLPLS